MKQIDKHHEHAGITLARGLAEQGIRIFKIEVAKKIASQLGMSPSYVKVALHHLKRNNWIEPIRRGVYTLDPIFLSGNPIHEFEIAMNLAENTIISHFSAFHHYGFTDQIPQSVYMTVPTKTTLPRVKKDHPLQIWGTPYVFSQIQLSQFFGHQTIWVGDAKIKITDKERTLLDGLLKPQYCGGIREVIEAYQQNIKEINLQLLIDIVHDIFHNSPNKLL